MSNFYFKSGSQSNVVLVAKAAAEGKSYTSKKDGQQYTILSLTTHQNYVSNGENRVLTQSIPVYVPGTLDVRAGDLVTVTGELKVSEVAPKSDKQKYPVSQVVITNAKAEAVPTDVDFGGINQAFIIGRVGNVRQITGKTPGVVVSVAVTKSAKTANGWQDDTSWFEVSMFGKRAEGLQAKAAKGDLIYVRGRLSQRATKVGSVEKQLLHFGADDFNILKKAAAAAAVSQTPAPVEESTEVPVF